LDICGVRALIIPIPHVPEAVVAIPLQIRSNFLEMFVKDFPSMFTGFPQKGTAPSAGVCLIGVVVVCKAGEAFGDRGGNEMRNSVSLDHYHFLEPVWYIVHLQPKGGVFLRLTHGCCGGGAVCAIAQREIGIRVIFVGTIGRMIAETAVVLIVIIISSIDARGLVLVDAKGSIGSVGRARIGILECRICILIPTLVNAGSPSVRLSGSSGLLVVNQLINGNHYKSPSQFLCLHMCVVLI